MTWHPLSAEKQLDELIKASSEHPVLIFKHSTRCSISSTALDRMERNWDDAQAKNIEPYYLDLIQYRPISNAIAERFGIEHQSPQVLLIKGGECIYDASHYDIRFQEVIKHV